MNVKQLARAATPDALAAYLVERPVPTHDHGGPVESVRETDHKGHHIVIRTTYRVEVDGRAIDLPLGVDNDGHVHCHSLPNYQFASAVDMVKQVIGSFPRDFPKRGGRPPQPAGPMSQEDHMHMRRRSRKSKGR